MHRICPDHMQLAVLWRAFGWLPAQSRLTDRMAPDCEVCADDMLFEVFELAAGDLAESNLAPF